MESEKVKEIKKALECCTQNEIEDTCEYCSNCPASDWDYEKECNVELFQKTITLINELESENERLRKKNFHLLERNRDLIRVCDTCRISIKQFSERLKEHPTMKIYSLHNACERIPMAIEETLKEFLGGQND